MKKIKVNVDDLIVVLEALKDGGTSSVILFEFEGTPAMADADEPENIILFQASEDQGMDDEDVVH